MRRALLATGLLALVLAPGRPAVGSDAPAVTGVTPGALAAGITTEVTIEGQGFGPGATVSFVSADFPSAPASTVQWAVVESSTRIRALVATSVPGGPAANQENVVVTNPDGAAGVLPRGLVVNPVPVYVHASPSVLARGTAVPVSVECTRCQPATGATVSGTGVSVGDFSGTVPYSLTLTVAPDAPLGTRVLTVAFVDRGAVSTPVEVVDRSQAADRAISVEVGTLAAGEAGRFTVTVANAGPAPAPLTSISAQLPAWLTVTGSSGPLGCGSGSSYLYCGPSSTPLAPGASLVQHVDVAVAPDAPRRAAVTFSTSGDSSVAELSYANNATTARLLVRSAGPSSTTSTSTPSSTTSTSTPSSTTSTSTKSKRTTTTTRPSSTSTTAPTSSTTSTTTTTVKSKKTTTTAHPSSPTSTAPPSTPTTSTPTTNPPPSGAPVIVSFTPGSGPPGTVVTIVGEHLEAAVGVTLGGAPVTVKSVSPTEIRVVTRPHNETGPFTVTTASHSATSSQVFTVTPAAKAYVDWGDD